MKRYLLPLFLLFLFGCFCLSRAVAQSGPYGNEWIDYGKTYYKFRVGKTGVCRIYRAALDVAGVPSTVPGSRFSLFRDGQEVPVWVSAETMSGTDYIEFQGRKGDGLLDRELYAQSAHHPDDRISMFSDTATYYLTYDNSGNHLRYAKAANAIPGGALTPEPYGMATAGYYPRNVFLPGASLSPAGGDELISSAFTSGEGFVHRFESINDQPSLRVTCPNPAPGADARVRASVITRSYINDHRVKIGVNGLDITEAPVGKAATHHFDERLPAAALGVTNDVRFVASSQGGGSYDGFGVSFVEIEYPRSFDMSGTGQAHFRLPATGAAQYIECPGLGPGRLYDIASRKWYEGNTDVSGRTRFYLPPAFAAREIVLLSDAATDVQTLTPVKSIRFTDYRSSTAQGDLIIITHSALMQPVGGRNYVQEYAAYRTSAAGGSHRLTTADVTELYDQFGYGYDMHPMALKHFLKYALDRWTIRPKDVLLVGRGLLYHEIPAYRANPAQYNFPVVPTYGHPGSDISLVLFGTQPPALRIGRISVWNGAEIGTYLSKLQAYEAAVPPSAMPTPATELWKKRMMHVIGATDRKLQAEVLEPAMYAGAAIISDSFAGKKVFSISKSDNQAVTSVNSAMVDSLLRGGLSMISFYGHASTFSFDYNLPAPETYTASPRLPFFTALGCEVSQMFRLGTQKTLAERYILAPGSGSIGFLASDNISFTGFDDMYLHALYRNLTKTQYGAAMGAHYTQTYADLIGRGGSNPEFLSAQLESMIYSGDPSLKLPAPALPDYALAAEGISSIPGNVSTTLDSFRLRIHAYNLGKAVSDSVTLDVEHINPGGALSAVRTVTLYGLRFSDTVFVTVPVHKTDDLGLNKYRVTIDAAGRAGELSESNNTASLELFIYSDNLIPVYPKAFAIVSKGGITLKASTLNPFRAAGRYRMELDTTALFNSPLKQSASISAPGGVIKWTPAIQYADSTVYYWRAAFDSAVNGDYHWSGSSFTYIAGSEPGWSQGHYYQYLEGQAKGMSLQPDRKFRFGAIEHKLQVANMMLGGTGNYDADGVFVRTYWDDFRVEQSSYGGVLHALQVLVVDSASGRIWLNDGKTPGAPPPLNARNGTYSRQFNLADPSSRIAAGRFLDTIPDGSYVLVKNVWWRGYGYPAYADIWKADSVAAGGSSNTLYAALRRLGFSTVDSFNRERVFVFMRRKGDPAYPVFQAFTDSLTQRIEKSWVIKGSDISGEWHSTRIGPAKSWSALRWQTGAYDTLSRNDSSSLRIIGVDASGQETLLAQKVSGDTSLAGISAAAYPFLKIAWQSKDSLNTTSAQLRYWRVHYTPVPEAALNPGLHYLFADSLAQGQPQTFSAAIENLSELPMDSLLVRFKIIGQDGVTHMLGDKRYRPLGALDTLHAGITFDPAAWPGKNLFFIEANPAGDQPEDYHPNNLGYAPFRISVDAHNPMLDVTFDGVHILNGDIVSAKPFIRIRLKDENRHLALNDTALLKVSLRYPGSSQIVDIPFDGTTCRFIPAAAGSAANEAVVEYRPALTQDGSYQLSVSGADRSGNGAGGTQGANARSTYRISFEVDNKPAITNVLNYPNPFSTATAFVFTLTGSQVPQLKIQILSVTGKVVREIGREELGPLHIGRNITEYQWDGRDQFGQLLGNGVYLYRVVSSLNGQDMDLRNSGVDKYFKNGYGKMYIMR